MARRAVVAREQYYDRRNRAHLIRHHQHALARLGCHVTVVPPGHGTPRTAAPAA
jgi:hypothetical protein